MTTDPTQHADATPLDLLIEGWREMDSRAVFQAWPAPEAVYFAQLRDEVSIMRRRRGRFFGTSPVEAEALRDL